ncbi:hypothetical protein AAK706_13415, partial [Erysipelotrichaceae bacterium 66-17]
RHIQKRDPDFHALGSRYLLSDDSFLGVILLVSALNIMNCLSMSVSSQIRQYGTSGHSEWIRNSWGA